MDRALAMLLAAWLCASAVFAAETPTLELIMSDPDWIGAAPEHPWWADDGTAVYYQQKRPGADIRDVYRLDLASGEAALAERSAPPGDGGRLYFQRDGQYFAFDLAGGDFAQITHLHTGKDPAAEPEFDALRAQQRRNYATLVEDKRRARALEEANRAARGDLPRLTDEAWINWERNEFGWLADNRTLWYLSEESGYSHLYRTDVGAGPSRQLTDGAFEVWEPVIDASERYAYVAANRAHPGNYEIYRVPLAGGALEQVTDLDGVSSFVLAVLLVPRLIELQEENFELPSTRSTATPSSTRNPGWTNTAGSSS